MEPWKKGYRQYLQPIIAFPFRTYPQILWSIFFHIFIYLHYPFPKSLNVYFLYTDMLCKEEAHTEKTHTKRFSCVCFFMDGARKLFFSLVLRKEGIQLQ